MDHWSWKYIERPRRIIKGFIFALLKWDNAEIIQHEVNKHRNELVYNDPFEIVKLLGWTDQFDDDYFWIVYNGEKGLQLYSCVGGFLWLKRRLSLFEYNYAKEIFELNTLPLETILKEVKDKGYILK